MIKLGDVYAKRAHPLEKVEVNAIGAGGYVFFFDVTPLDRYRSIQGTCPIEKFVQEFVRINNRCGPKG